MASPGRLVALSDIGVRRKEIALVGALLSIGRSERNTIVLDDDSVSKHHAEIALAKDGSFWLRDLGSSNGTVVNGSLARSEHRLREGDEVEIGLCRFRYTEQPPATRVHLAQSDAISRTSVLATSAVESFVAGESIDDLRTMRRHYDRVRTALDAVRRMVSTTDPEQLGRLILDVTFELVSAEAGAVLLLGDD
ncbi:MAG: FHA domain-containing protein, partial [Myxococcota bacterium]